MVQSYAKILNEVEFHRFISIEKEKRGDVKDKGS